MNQGTETPEQIPFFRSRWERVIAFVMLVGIFVLIAVAIRSDLQKGLENQHSASNPSAIIDGAPGLLTGFVGVNPRVMPGWEAPAQGEKSRKTQLYDESFGKFAQAFSDEIFTISDPNLQRVVFTLMLKDKHPGHDQPCITVHIFTVGMDRDQEAYHRILTEPTVPEGLVHEAYWQVRETLYKIQHGERL